MWVPHRLASGVQFKQFRKENIIDSRFSKLISRDKPSKKEASLELHYRYLVENFFKDNKYASPKIAIYFYVREQLIVANITEIECKISFKYYPKTIINTPITVIRCGRFRSTHDIKRTINKQTIIN